MLLQFVTLYLLTGAAGFLGSNICRQLIERGARVRAFILKGDPAIRFVPEEAELFEGNLCNAEDVNRFFDVPEGTRTICIHCASMVTVNPDFSQKLIDVNVGGTENIINACLSHKSNDKLLYISSTGAIPEKPKGTKIREIRQFDQDKVVGWYSKSKAIATQKVLDSVRTKGLNACVVHPTGIMGPGDFAGGMTTGAIIQICNGELPVGMAGSFNLVDVRDLADGCIAAADKGRTGECYILGNEEITFKEMCRILQKDLGCKGPRFFLPLGIAKLIAGQMEKKAKKSGKKPIMTTFSVYNLERNNAFDYSKAQNELGYVTRPCAETLHDEAKWLREEGKIGNAS